MQVTTKTIPVTTILFKNSSQYVILIIIIREMDGVAK